jgi:uncharacterized membrane protein YfcA
MFYYIGLVVLGFAVGLLSGLFGVGGGFLLVPMLNAVFNIPYNIAVGSSLCQMIGTSAAAGLKHHGYGHIDYKLAIWLLVGSIAGAEIGAQILMWLRGMGDIAILGQHLSVMYVSVNTIFLVLLLTIGSFMFFESKGARRHNPHGAIENTVMRKLRAIKLAPVISLPVSEISSISLWCILVIGFMVGVFSGLLGVGGGFVLNPALIYLVGVSTSVSIGTGLFQIMFVSIYGTMTHFVKGNIDFMLVGCILGGSLIGSHFGAVLHKRTHMAHIRYYFSLLVLAVVAVILIKFVYSLGYLGK